MSDKIRTFEGTVRKIEIFVTITSEKGGVMRVPVEQEQLHRMKVGYPASVLLEDVRTLDLMRLSDR